MPARHQGADPALLGRAGRRYAAVDGAGNGEGNSRRGVDYRAGMRAFCVSGAFGEKKTRDRLEKSAANRSRDETENSIVNEICKHATAEIPDAMIENEIDRMVQDFSYRLMYQGIKLEEYLEYMKLSMEQFRSQFTEQATPRVMSQLVIDKIVKEEKFTLADGELDAKIEEQAKSVGKTLEEYKKTIDPRQVEYITNDIIITKLFDFLQANNDLYTE